MDLGYTVGVIISPMEVGLGYTVGVIISSNTCTFCRALVYELFELKRSDEGNLPRANLSSAQIAGCHNIADCSLPKG